MSYFIRYWKKDNKGNIEEGILNIPDDISDKEAQKLIKEGTAVKWDIPLDAAKEYKKRKEENEEPKKDLYHDLILDNIKQISEDRWITKKGRHIWIKTHYTPEEYYERFKFAGDPTYFPKYEIAEINRKAELSAWLKIDKNVELDWRVKTVNNALDILPLKIKKMIKDVYMYKGGVAEDPHFIGRQDEIPTSYKRIGVEKSWREIGGAYIPDENRAVLGMGRGAATLFHEVGHAVWYGISETDRQRFKDIHWVEEKRVRDIWGDYEANDVQELFAESFSRYWEAKYQSHEYYGGRLKIKQRQVIGKISRFFNTRMQKYFKDK